ncbi:unnamed protein product [Trichogramma brassicae]|uniref:G-protein coupled receptors family 2 profile 1 domain-containing protein n=1 Tax=Trichogramma brassicae TaxID=86971 RepID=A0A6H5HSY6_9HYME|nr:unnamed protein product [Trichogramma brassicae]
MPRKCITLAKPILARLKRFRQMVNWEIESDRRQQLDQLYPLVKDWQGQLPNLRDVFRPEEIERILIEVVKPHESELKPDPIIKFVIKTGYKDQPDVDEEGKPSPRRTTPLHYAFRRWLSDGNTVVGDLFKIYDRFDVNYTDEFGCTHFHVACKFNFVDIVEKFLEFGQDPNTPNCLPRESDADSVDPPLHLTLKCNHKKVVELLLKSGADPNLANKGGSTALHIVSFDLVEMLFELSNEKYRPIQVNAQDERGRTPLHLGYYYNLEASLLGPFACDTCCCCCYTWCGRAIDLDLYSNKEPYCRGVWDGWSCWPDTPAGETVYQSCPTFVTGFDPMRGILASLTWRKNVCSGTERDVNSRTHNRVCKHPQQQQSRKLPYVAAAARRRVIFVIVRGLANNLNFVARTLPRGGTHT